MQGNAIRRRGGSQLTSVLFPISAHVIPLLPRINASPYLFLSCKAKGRSSTISSFAKWTLRSFPSSYLHRTCPLTYSSVCSNAMFINPSRHASLPGFKEIRRRGRERWVRLNSKTNDLGDCLSCKTGKGNVLHHQPLHLDHDFIQRQQSAAWGSHTETHTT